MHLPSIPATPTETTTEKLISIVHGNSAMFGPETCVSLEQQCAGHITQEEAAVYGAELIIRDLNDDTTWVSLSGFNDKPGSGGFLIDYVTFKNPIPSYGPNTGQLNKDPHLHVTGWGSGGGPQPSSPRLATYTRNRAWWVQKHTNSGSCRSTSNNACRILRLQYWVAGMRALICFCTHAHLCSSVHRCHGWIATIL